MSIHDLKVSRFGHSLIRYIENNHSKETKGRIQGKIAAIIAIACTTAKKVKTYQEIYNQCYIDERLFSQSLKKIKLTVKSGMEMKDPNFNDDLIEIAKSFNKHVSPEHLATNVCL